MSNQGSSGEAVTQWDAGEGKVISLDVRDPGTLSADPHNSKVHTNEQVEHVIASISDFGFNDPIGVREDGQIVEGHARWEAAQRLGMEEVPVLVLTGFTEEELRLYSVAHNKLTLQTRMDPAAVATMLSRAYAGNADMADWSDLGIKDSELGISVDRDISAEPKLQADGQPSYRAHRNAEVEHAVAEYEVVLTPAEHTKFSRFARTLLTDGNKNMPVGDRLAGHMTKHIDAAIQSA